MTRRKDLQLTMHKRKWIWPLCIWKKLAHIRAGKASTRLLDGIRVDSYGEHGAPSAT